MTVVASSNAFAMRRIIKKYNGTFSGSTHNINGTTFIRMFSDQNKQDRILLPFIFKGKPILATSLAGTLQIQVD